MDIDGLSYVKELAETNKTIKEQVKDFEIKVRKKRRTFFHYRKKLGLKGRLRKRRPYGYALKDKEICYFCLRQAQIIHHINENRKDNNKENLLPLCQSCHNKIHRIYNNYFKRCN